MILLSVAWPLFLALILVFVSIEIVKWLQPRLATTKRLLRSKVRDVKVKLLAKRIRKTNKRDLPAWW